MAIADLIAELRQLRPHAGLDPTVIDRLAGMGPDVIQPLLAAAESVEPQWVSVRLYR